MTTLRKMQTWILAIKSNRSKLEQCLQHNFVEKNLGDPLNQRYKCLNCGGEIDMVAFYWYSQGRADMKSQLGISNIGTPGDA